VKLPQKYHALNHVQRRKVREEYVRVQHGNCWYCKMPLNGDPIKVVMDLDLDMSLFPNGFLKWPVHLHHNHNTDWTIGAVHSKCNGILFQYYGE